MDGHDVTFTNTIKILSPKSSSRQLSTVKTENIRNAKFIDKPTMS